MTINDNQGIDGFQDYYPFGKVMPGRSYTSGNLYDNYKFTGHERDNEFDLTLDYMQARMYDPVIGRFLSVDPALEYNSPYTYVGNNSLRRTDPTGMYSREVSCEEMLLSGSQTALEFKHGQNQFNENQTTTNDPDENSSSCVGLKCQGNSFEGISSIAANTSNTAGFLNTSGSVAAERWLRWAGPRSEAVLRHLPADPVIRVDYVRSARTFLIGTGFATGIAGLGITGYDYYENNISTFEFGVDAVFGGAAFFWPVGTAASATYFSGKYFFERYTGQSLYRKPGK